MKEGNENFPIPILQYLGSKIEESKRNVERYIRVLAEQEKKYPGFLASLKKLIDSPTSYEFVEEARHLDSLCAMGYTKREGLINDKINLVGKQGTVIVSCYKSGAISVFVDIPRCD